MFDDNIEDDEWWDPSKSYTGWDYKNYFGEDALKKNFIKTRKLVIVLSFLGYLPCAFLIYLSKQKNGLFVTFSRSNSFGVLEHNALLDALAHPVKGLNLFEYDELGFDLINNVKFQ